jgi:hypothetical protein
MKMAAFIPCVNVAEVVFTWDLIAQNVVNTFHFQGSTSLNETFLENLVGELMANFIPDFTHCISANMGLASVAARDLTTPTSAFYDLHLNSADIVGTINSDSLPSNAALVVTNYTDTRGKNGRGRQYVGGLPLTRLTNALTVASNEITDVLTAFGKLLVAANTATMAWVVLSRYFNKAPRAAGVTYPIKAVQVNSAIDSQRRRLYGRGR